MIRSFPGYDKKIFLTFDDGPSGKSTSRVLDVLATLKVPATFFLIGKDIRPQHALVERMVNDGHAIGNHSWDHLYGNYFTNQVRLRRWIGQLNEELAMLKLPQSVGFRPPAGVVTPQLSLALRSLAEPLVMWSERFFDSVFALGRAKVERSARKLSGGSIVLLHDGQREDRIDGFCDSLELYIQLLRGRGFEFAALTREICMREEKL